MDPHSNEQRGFTLTQPVKSHARRRSPRQATLGENSTLTRPSAGADPSSPWSQCFSRSYASVLPTSLGHIAPLTRAYSARSPDAVIGTAVPVREATTARDMTSCPITPRYHGVVDSISGRAFVRIVKAPRTALMERAAFPMCSGPFLHLK